MESRQEPDPGQGGGEGSIVRRGSRVHQEGRHRGQLRQSGDGDGSKVGLQIPEGPHGPQVPAKGRERIRAHRFGKEAVPEGTL